MNVMLYKNILLIDDDSDDADIFMEAINAVHKDIILSYESNPVNAFHNLQDSENVPDLIFLDFNMPLLNGRDFLSKMKCESHLCTVPVIMISSPSMGFFEDLLFKNEITHYISKPSSYSELIKMLKDILFTSL